MHYTNLKGRRVNRKQVFLKRNKRINVFECFMKWIPAVHVLLGWRMMITGNDGPQVWYDDGIQV